MVVSILILKAVTIASMPRTLKKYAFSENAPMRLHSLKSATGVERTGTGMADICGDNRFELIEKYKQKLLDATNIEDSPEEMAAIDNVLFRLWQIGWLEKLELFGNSELLSSSGGHEKDHVADPGKMVVDLVSRQAAIDALKMDISIIPFAKAREYVREAIETIYNRLEELPSAEPEVRTQMSSADCISRQEALRIFEEHCYPVRYDHNSIDKGMTLPGIVEVLNMTPPAQRWIPCSERLPEEQEEVLVSTPDYICIAELETIQGTRYWSEVIEYRTLYDVIAWMPLPEPYKEHADD